MGLALQPSMSVTEKPLPQRIAIGVVQPRHRPEPLNRIAEPHRLGILQHLRPDSGYFDPTPQWDKLPGNDRLWS